MQDLLVYLTLACLLFCSIDLYSGEGSITPQQALKRLMDGNERYVQEKLLHPNRGQKRREAVFAKQRPYAIIVSCSDARVAPEIIFDEGVGDLFVVRVAGNVIGPLELASIEYAALYLKSAVILVMGHENCGAVKAVIQKDTESIEPIAQLIEPSVQEAKKMNPSHLLEFAVKANALNMQSKVDKSPQIAKLVKDKQIETRAAYYNLQTGRVELLSP